MADPLMNIPPRRSRLRTVIAPLVIMVTAAVIAWWAADRQVERISRMEDFILTLCADVGRHYADTEDVPYANPAVPSFALPVLSSVCERYTELSDAIDVEVTTGDVYRAQYEATHTATIMLNGTPRLILRLKWNDPPRPIEILGYVDPDGL